MQGLLCCSFHHHSTLSSRSYIYSGNPTVSRLIFTKMAPDGADCRLAPTGAQIGINTGVFLLLQNMLGNKSSHASREPRAGARGIP